MRIFYNLFSALGVAVLLVGLSETLQAASTPTTIGNLTYNVNTVSQTASCQGFASDATDKTTVDIPATIIYNNKVCNVSIGTAAFLDQTSIESVTIAEGITSITSSAFSNCSNLSKLSLPSTISIIYSNAFQNCSKLTGDLTLPENIKEVQKDAFYGTGYTGTLVLPEGLTTLGTYAFRGIKFTGTLTIPSTLSSMGESAFSGCTGFTNLVIKEGCSSIGNRAFNGCTGLIGNLILPSSLKNCTTWSSAFLGCTGFTSITIENGIESIPLNAFQNCTNVKTIYLPTSLTNVSTNAFSGCSGITEIYCEAIVPPTTTTTSSNTSFPISLYETCKLYVPSESLDYYKSTDGPYSSYQWHNFFIEELPETIDFVNLTLIYPSGCEIKRQIPYGEDLDIQITPPNYWGVSAMTVNGVNETANINKTSGRYTLTAPTEDQTLVVTLVYTGSTSTVVPTTSQYITTSGKTINIYGVQESTEIIMFTADSKILFNGAASWYYNKETGVVTFNVEDAGFYNICLGGTLGTNSAGNPTISGGTRYKVVFTEISEEEQ